MKIITILTWQTSQRYLWHDHFVLVPWSQNSRLDTGVHILHNSPHNIVKFVILLGYVAAVEQVRVLDNAEHLDMDNVENGESEINIYKDLLNSSYWLVGQVWTNKNLEKILQVGQILDNEWTVVRVINLRGRNYYLTGKPSPMLMTKGLHGK